MGNLLGEAFRKVISENFEADGNFYVYHGTESDAINGLAKTGFERSWTGSGGGNMYGKGVYTTYTWSTRGCNARGNYGQSVVKALVKSLKKFVIYDSNLAIKVYGEFNIPKQIIDIFGKDFFDELRHTNEYCNTPDGRTIKVTYDKVINSNNDPQSSTCAWALASFIFTKHPEAEFKTNGYIFCGGHDADVCFIKDFKNVYPVEISYDLGRTFTPIAGLKGDKFDKFAREDVDLYFQLGKHNFKLMRELDEFPNYFINNFARVKKGGKYNFLYRGRSLKLGVISPVWFDEAPKTFSDRGTAIVTVDGDMYILAIKDGNFYVYSNEGNYICGIDDFERYLNESSYEDEFDEEF